MTYPIGQNNQLYYTGIKDNIKDVDLKEKAPSAGVADTAVDAASNPLGSLKNIALGALAVAGLDMLMSLGLAGDKNSGLNKLVNWIEGTKWAQNQRKLKADALLNQSQIKNNTAVKTIKAQAWFKNFGDKLLGSAKSAFNLGKSSKSLGMKMPASHRYLDIEHAKAMKEGGKGLEGVMKTQRDLIKQVDKVQGYKTVTLKNGKVIKVAVKEATGLSRAISKFYIGVKHFVGTGVAGGNSAGPMKFLQKVGGGSIVGYLMNGVFIGMSIKEAKHAPEGERGKAFMEDIMGNWIFGFACWPMISRFVNGLTGFAHTGKMAEKHIANNTILKGKATKYHFVDQIAKTGKYNTNAPITAELKKELDSILANKNPQKAARKEMKSLTKTLRKAMPWRQRWLSRAGKLVSMGRNHTWANFKSTKGFLPKTGKFLSYAFKRIPGGMFRMVALVGALSYPFAYVGKQVSHLIFGKPNMDKNKVDSKIPTQNPENQIPETKSQQRVRELLAQREIEANSNHNQQAFKKPEPKVTHQPPKAQIDRAPRGPVNKEPVKKQEVKEAKYIPSSTPMIVDNSMVDQEIAGLVNKAGRYETYAKDLLDSV